jgi:hypothetical protein
MTASGHMVELTTYQDHHGLKPVAATRRTNIIAVVCITAFAAWCLMPAVVWAAQLGLTAWRGNHPAEPPQLSSRAAPMASIDDRLIDIERKP